MADLAMDGLDPRHPDRGGEDRKKAPRKIRNAKRAMPEKKMIASGIQAIGGMNRNGSITERVRA